MFSVCFAAIWYWLYWLWYCDDLNFGDIKLVLAEIVWVGICETEPNTFWSLILELKDNHHIKSLTPFLISLSIYTCH